MAQLIMSTVTIKDVFILRLIPFLLLTIIGKINNSIA